MLWHPPRAPRSIHGLDPADIDHALRTLEALLTDPGRLAALDPARRRALLEAAGRLSRPHKHERVQLAKALRRGDRSLRRGHDAALLDATEIRSARRADVFAPPPRHEKPPLGELATPRACYVCKASFSTLHFFYDQLCPPCAAQSYDKRFQSVDLTGRVALVTGARVKIGFQTVLLLLRAGARVVATTRFPHDAARRYAAEPDFATFQDRLEIHGLDLRHVPSVEVLARWLAEREGRLDLLVNNAAQTVRRPRAFYRHLLGAEAAVPEASWRRLFAANDALRADLGDAGRRAIGPGASLVSWQGGLSPVGLLHPAEMSQLALAPDDLEDSPELFPLGAVDGDLQQVDRRRSNSWRLEAADVTTPELLEVHLVNAIAPFILCSRLRPLLARVPTRDAHVVNVSAMEASFSRKKKTDKHPHTNMAKAALNMLTRTSAADYARAGIHMNSVDTGWVTDEDPLHHAERKQRVHDFHAPLDPVDGAARVLDPVFTGHRTGQHSWGKFWKDYRVVDW